MLYSQSPREKNFFFLKIFRPIRIREKIKCNYSAFSPLEWRDQWILMLKKFYFPFVVLWKSTWKIFFLSKFLNQSDFEKKWNSIIPLFLHSNRQTREHWCWKNSIDRSCIVQIREKKIFYQNFSTNQNSRKNQIQYFDFFLIGIERPMKTDAKKILLTFVVLSKSATKNFFSIIIFRRIRIREKIKFNYSFFFSLESRDQWTLMLKKFYWPFLYSRNPREKIFFLLEFFDQSEFAKNEFQLFQFFPIRIDRPVNTDAEKILLTFLVFSKSARKNFFFIKIFRPIRIWEKWISIIPVFPHSNRQTSQHWCWKNSIDPSCIVQIREKNFFLSKFFDQSEFAKKWNSIIRFFYKLESRDQWTLMVKKFDLPLLYSRNPRQKISFLL